MSLTFNELRQANIARLPVFKNSLGEPAHSEPDGSDWSLSGWANAVMGELGEASEALGHYVALGQIMKHLGRAGNLIKKIERANYTLEQKRQELGKELADVQV